MFEPAE